MTRRHGRHKIPRCGFLYLTTDAAAALTMDPCAHWHRIYLARPVRIIVAQASGSSPDGKHIGPTHRPIFFSIKHRSTDPQFLGTSLRCYPS
jgi:hypothetical protein